MKDTIPNEATTGYIAQQEVDGSPSIQNFLEGLTAEERGRFMQIAHHLVYIGFEEGMVRRHIEPTDDVKARVLINETSLFLRGAGKLAEEIGM